MQIKKAPGIEDIFPDKIDGWNFIIQTAKNNFGMYNFKEIVIPILEFTEVFTRSLGEETDIVSKEMFTFEDRGGRSLTLRPEGTASVVRAYSENGDYNRLSVCKLFYCGQMFRAEKPQKGRLRQFNQFGAELFGDDDPFYDFEIISMMNKITCDLGIKEYKLLINSIGCEKCRPDYIKDLKNYYNDFKSDICESCNKRLDTNPLRILDCKVEKCRELKHKSPKITNYLCDDCSSHHTELKKLLLKNNILFTEDPFLVRGLDYYCKTTFEFVTDNLGSQNAFAAGGRYNNLVEMFAGKKIPAVGFAAGIERLSLLLNETEIPKTGLDCFIVYGNNIESKEIALDTVSLLRNNGISADIDPVSKGLKSQLKKAERENAAHAIIIGDDETAGKYFSVKNLLTREQTSVPLNEIVNYLKSKKI